ncbi:hypothetical protein HHK36_029405 [Tetracentron sinense]|uniref:Uncharacterized protein n=1 Tax=Tetracentron sinense TaxID=13715 RepID=A0A835CZQ3_TETSI|nr:hypothetical protein HHK36_029405 [Tetracentron sinense]
MKVLIGRAKEEKGAKKGRALAQEVTTNKLHMQNPHGPALFNNLKKYYSKAPPVELCVQAGSSVIPELDEVDLVA